jgi:hypothetical protein
VIEVGEGTALVAELLEDPESFTQRGRAYQLLQAVFAGFPVDSLVGLLAHQNASVQRAALFVASELGEQARHLVPSVVPLTASGNRHLAYGALEVLSVCATGDLIQHFLPLVNALEHDDQVIRSLAMRLLVRASTAQLAAACQQFSQGDDGNSVHLVGLRSLLAGSKLELEKMASLIASSDAVLCRYGAVALCRRGNNVRGVDEIISGITNGEILDFINGCRSPATEAIPR